MTVKNNNVIAECDIKISDIFDFKNQKEGSLISNVEFNYKKIKFLSNEIFIPSNAEIKTINGDIRNEKVTINLKEFKSLFENDFSFIKDQEIIFETKNKFSFKIQKGKIKKLLQYFSSNIAAV